MNLSPKQSSRIIFEGLVRGGVKDPKTLSNITNTHLATTYQRLKRMQEEGTLKKRPVTGRPKKIQSSSMTRLHQLAIKNPLASNKQLAKRMEETVETTISRWTIGRDLEKLGLVRKRPRRAPVLTQRHKDARLAWCLQHKDWDWNGVVFF